MLNSCYNSKAENLSRFMAISLHVTRATYVPVLSSAVPHFQDVNINVLTLCRLMHIMLKTHAYRAPANLVAWQWRSLCSFAVKSPEMLDIILHTACISLCISFFFSVAEEKFSNIACSGHIRSKSVSEMFLAVSENNDVSRWVCLSVQMRRFLFF